MPQTTLSDLLTGLTSSQKADRKAEALVGLLNSGEYKLGNKFVRITRYTTFTRNGVTIDLVSASVVNGCFGLVLNVSDARGPLPMPNYTAGEMYLFRNPPTMRRNDDGSAVEDIAAVVQGFVYDAVVAYARSHGWSPVG
jgi:hypothetical protein